MRGHSTSRQPGARRTGALSSLGLLILLALVGWICFRQELSPIDPSTSSSVSVTIPKGEDTSEIASLIAENGLVRNKTLFLIEIQISGKGSQLQAGSYSLSRSMSADEMIDKIAAGDTDSELVSVPEGFTAAQIGDRLASKGLCDKLDFLQTVATEGDTFTFGDGFTTPRNLEGYLYPLTYNVLRKGTTHQIAGQMVTAFDLNIVRKFPRVRDWRSVVTVASLVEREAGVDSDRPLIASVFYNRLRLGMPLQCDATVQYGLPEHKSRLMFSDLRVDSPYNTYLHKGLPPGPICNPGLKSIEAAVHPAHTDSLFYVAGPTGASIFSRTLAEQDREIALLRPKT